MKTKLLCIFAATILLLAGCGNGAGYESGRGTVAPTTEPVSPTSALPEIIEPTETVEPGAAISIEDRLKGLRKNAYEGIEMTAEIPEGERVAPGDVVPVTVRIKNTGDKTVFYTHGSGSTKTPEALMVEVKGLQTILPEDRLGIMTLDLQTKELMPGDELQFVANIMVIQPHERFDEYTYEIYGKDETYIGRIALPDLQQIYADIKAAATGSYDGKVYFTYFAEGAGSTDANSAATSTNETTPQYLTSGDNGYAAADFQITVSD